MKEVRPPGLGALLEGLSEGVRSYDSVGLDRLRRVADSCKWTVPCEGTCWLPDPFTVAYEDARASATEEVCWGTRFSARRRAGLAPFFVPVGVLVSWVIEPLLWLTRAKVSGARLPRALWGRSPL